MSIAIIPARGGSKRIPGKNIRGFAGKPLIAYSIEVALQSGLFEHVIVSTDSEEVAQTAKKYGASVPFFRPAELSDDFTGTRKVTNHAIRECQARFGDFEFACCIYATAPFLQADYLQQGLTKLRQDKTKAFAFSVTSFPFPVQRALVEEGQGVVPMYPEFINKRSQDLPEGLHDAGQFYWGRCSDYFSDKPMFGTHSVPIKIPRHLVQDIDTEEDWQRAELMYRAYKQPERHE